MNYPDMYTVVCEGRGQRFIQSIFFVFVCVYIHLRACESDLRRVVPLSDGGRTKTDTKLRGGAGLHDKLQHTNRGNSFHRDSKGG